jgi:hypothetical protein
MFAVLKQLLEPYKTANILTLKNIKSGGVSEYVFKKGAYQFDIGLIDRLIIMANIENINNKYAYMTNPTFKQKWEQLYSGRVMRLLYRTSDVKFELINCKPAEFDIMYGFIKVFISGTMCHPNFKKPPAMTFQAKKLNKLKQLDPELYNLKKYGSEKVYSVICQNPNQPIVYTDEEMKFLTSEQKKKVVEYWNFTMNKPAYYACNGKQYPYLSFKVDMHPKGYCIPCCRKTQKSQSAKHDLIHSTCLTSHVWSEQMESARGYKHVIHYGKDIDVGRLMKLPVSPGFKKIFKVRATEPNYQHLAYFIYGIPQSTATINEAGVLFAICDMLSITLEEFVSSTAKLFSDERIFNNSLSGDISSTWSTPKDMLASVRKAILSKQLELVNQNFPRWNDLFALVAREVYGLYLVYFYDQDYSGNPLMFISDDTAVGISGGTELLSGEVTQSQGKRNMGCIIKIGRSYYPIYKFRTDRYFSTGEIEQRVYPLGSIPTSNILSLTELYFKYEIASRRQTNIDIEGARQFVANTNGKYVIKKIFINKYSKCYGILLSVGGDKSYSYLPVFESNISSSLGGDVGASDILTQSNQKDNIEHVYTPFQSNDYQLPVEVLVKTIDDLNIYLNKINSDTVFYEPITISNLLLDSTTLEVFALQCNNKFVYYFDSTSVKDQLESIRHDYKNGNNNGNRIIPIYTSPLSNHQINVTVAKLTLPIVITYNYNPINLSLYNESPGTSDNRLTNRDYAMYDNMLYQLLQNEFINYQNSERNASIRRQIVQLITPDFNLHIISVQDDLTKLLLDYTDDLAHCMELLTFAVNHNKTSAELLEKIQDSVFTFDKTSVNELRALPTDAAVKKLKVIMDNLITFGKAEDRKHIHLLSGSTNILAPCATARQNRDVGRDKDTSGNGACLGDKLLMFDTTTYDEYLKIMVADIKNPFKYRFIINGLFSRNIVDIFNFRQQATETVTITRIV